MAEARQKVLNSHIKDKYRDMMGAGTKAENTLKRKHDETLAMIQAMKSGNPPPEATKKTGGRRGKSSK